MGKRGIAYFIFWSILLFFSMQDLQMQENSFFPDASGLQAIQQSLVEMGNLENQDENLLAPSPSRFRKIGICPNKVGTYDSCNYLLSTDTGNHTFIFPARTSPRSLLCIYRI